MTTPIAAPIRGLCDPAFTPVRDAFEKNFLQHGEIGAAVSLVVDGKTVVDLWGGHMDSARTKEWPENAIVNVYSSTKGMGALCLHILADRGLIDFEAPVAKYWPEFGQAGKESLPVKYVLSHQSGLPAVDGPLHAGAALDWDFMVHAVERQRPYWEPGTAIGYQAVTYGWMVGELVRRISGRRIGQFFREEVAEPLGVDFFVGTPESEDYRVATMHYPDGLDGPTPTDTNPLFQDKTSLAYKATVELVSPPVNAHVNDRAWRSSENTAANGHGNARALARLYGALALGGTLDGVRLLSPESVDRARTLQVSARDTKVMMGPLVSHRALGYTLPQPEAGDIRGPKAFGHGGAGGSMGFADPDRGLGFGYVMNRMWRGGVEDPDPRAGSLVAAAYSCF